MDRPEVVTKDQLASPPTEQSAQMQRGEAFHHDRVWAGYSTFPGGATTGWHHHGDYDTYGYITEGAMMVEFGPGGAETVRVEAGDFVHIPAGMVHRESVPAQGGAGVVVRTGGEGPTVTNVDGPDAGGTADPSS